MRKFLVLLTTIILIVGIIGMPIKTAKAVVPAPPVPISPVSDFAICSPIPSTVNLSWSSVPGAVYYVVRCSTSPDFSILLYSATTPYNSVPYNFGLGIRYYWDVKVVTSGGESDWSSTATFEILPQPPELISPLGLIPPGNVLFVVRTCFWAPLKIRVFCCPYSSYSVFEVTLFPYQAIIIGGNRLEYRFASPYPFATGNYYWEAEVIVGTVESSWSNGYFQIIYPPSYAPQLISPSNGALVSNLSINLVWNQVAGANKYKVNINGVTVIVSTNSYSFIARDNTDNRWSVTPGNIAGWGPESETRYFKILLPPSTPQLIYPINGSVFKTNSVSIDWTRLDTAEYYLLEITDFTANLSTRLHLMSNHYQFTGEYQHSYNIKVKAWNQSGESNWSDSFWFSIQENIPPRIEIDSYSPYTNQTTITISGRVYDLESGIDALCLGSQQIFTNSDGTFQISFALQEGPNSFTLWAIDKAGNRTQNTVDIIKDITSPEITIIQPNNGAKVIYFTIKGIIKDNSPLSFLSLWINNKQIFIDSTGAFVFSPDSKLGLNQIYIKCRDAAGNETTKTLTVTKIPVSMTFIVQVGNPIMKQIETAKDGETISQETEIDHGRGTTPIINRNRIFVPIRVLIEAIGGQVFWDAESQEVTISVPWATIELWIGKNQARVNGHWVPIYPDDLSVAPFISNGRTFIPIRFVAEHIGGKVEWNEITEQAIITFALVPETP